MLNQNLLFALYGPNNIPNDFEKVVFTFKNAAFSDANFRVPIPMYSNLARPLHVVC